MCRVASCNDVLVEGLVSMKVTGVCFVRCLLFEMVVAFLCRNSTGFGWTYMKSILLTFDRHCWEAYLCSLKGNFRQESLWVGSTRSWRKINYLPRRMEECSSLRQLLNWAQPTYRPSNLINFWPKLLALISWSWSVRALSFRSTRATGRIIVYRLIRNNEERKQKYTNECLL